VVALLFPWLALTAYDQPLRKMLKPLTRKAKA
jgi:hypothetical protein